MKEAKQKVINLDNAKPATSTVTLIQGFTAFTLNLMTY